MDALVYQIALSLLPGIGSIRTRSILAHVGSAENFFTESSKILEKIPGVGSHPATNSQRKKALEAAKKEYEFVKNNHIRTAWFLDDDYPMRLKQCEDAPVIIYIRGDTNLDTKRIISIVGTRHATSYGIGQCKKIVEELAAFFPDLLVISGLAYGIDVCAHKAALKNGLQTVAVLGHGLHMIYPAIHRQVAREIVSRGALVTEFATSQIPDKGNFIARNRIIAGLADTTLVVESGIKGGALITADLANSYNRDVFALPGRTSDTWSQGCNQLIKRNQAALIESGKDIAYLMGWETSPPNKNDVQKELFAELNEEEKKLLGILKKHGEISVDQLAVLANISVSKVSSILLNLEFAGLITILPGNIYRYLA
ncbi:MAG TPA: DNA-protecting protein DprA [Bacteroidetes bacterium]|nr:DNA-protecting protein DprA [Bacteroidota bacterium]